MPQDPQPKKSILQRLISTFLLDDVTKQMNEQKGKGLAHKAEGPKPPAATPSVRGQDVNLPNEREQAIAMLKKTGQAQTPANIEAMLKRLRGK